MIVYKNLLLHIPLTIALQSLCVSDRLLNKHIHVVIIFTSLGNQSNNLLVPGRTSFPFSLCMASDSSLLIMPFD